MMNFLPEFLARIFARTPPPVVVPPPPPRPIRTRDLLSLSQLITIMPKTWPVLAPTWISPLNVAMDEYQINTPARIGMFLAQLAHESAELTRLEENLSYSADGLRRTFPKYFMEAEFALFARQPERTANRVYGNRNGNLGTETGDGWLYRGRGPIMLTGRNNYRDAGLALGLDLVGHPEWVATNALVGARTAANFWAINALNVFADNGNFAATTQTINGGTHGAADRNAYYLRAKAALA